MFRKYDINDLFVAKFLIYEKVKTNTSDGEYLTILKKQNNNYIDLKNIISPVSFRSNKYKIEFMIPLNDIYSKAGTNSNEEGVNDIVQKCFEDSGKQKVKTK